MTEIIKHVSSCNLSVELRTNLDYLGPARASRKETVNNVLEVRGREGGDG